MIRSGVRWRRRRKCPGTKRVLGRSRLTFRCHNATNVREREKGRERERERERERIRKVPSSFNIK